MNGRTSIVFAAVSALLIWPLLLFVFAHLKPVGMAWPGWIATIFIWLLAWLMISQLSKLKFRIKAASWALNLIIPLIFGLTLLFLWEVLTRGLGVPRILLPPPSQIGVRIANSIPILMADFQQTFLKAVLFGYVVGCSTGFVIAILVDRSPFMRKGLMPIGNLVAALPIVGTAPIMVMWFGFDWHSKAAVVVVMCFFPMLVNT